MYSWAGQLYTNLTAVYQRIKEISAGLTGFSGIKNAYRGREFFVAHERFLYAHESHELTRRQCATGMATGSVALICTNAMRELFLYDDNLDNF